MNRRSVIVAFMLQGKPLVVTDYEIDEQGVIARFASLRAAAAWYKTATTPGVRAAESVIAIDVDTGESEVLF